MAWLALRPVHISGGQWMWLFHEAPIFSGLDELKLWSHGNCTKALGLFGKFWTWLRNWCLFFKAFWCLTLLPEAGGHLLWGRSWSLPAPWPSGCKLPPLLLLTWTVGSWAPIPHWGRLWLAFCLDSWASGGWQVWGGQSILLLENCAGAGCVQGVEGEGEWSVSFRQV